MSTFAEMLTELVAEFQNAIEDAHPYAVRHWRGKLIEAVRLMLDYDSEGVLWAIEGCELLEGLEAIEMTHGADDSGECEPSEEDRALMAGEFDEVARLDPLRDDYSVQEGDPPYEVKYDFLLRDEPGIGPHKYDLDDRQFGITEEESPPSSALEMPSRGKSQKEMFS